MITKIFSNMKRMTITSLFLVCCQTNCKSRNFSSKVSTKDEAKLNEFFNREEWPHFSDYVNAFGSMPTTDYLVGQNFVGTKYVFRYSETKFRNFTGNFREIYQAIAGLEYAYPNANYSCVGRDAMLVCDMLDAFYQNYTGEKRVSYIGVSGISFEKIRNSMDKMLDVSKKLLLSSGFNPKDYVKVGSNTKPFVLIDATGWYAKSNDDNDMSQVRILMKAAYALVRKAGGNNDEILEKIGTLGTSSGSGRTSQNYYWLYPKYNKSLYFEDIKRNMKSDFDHPSDILRLQLAASSYGNLFWHDKFGEINTDASGVTKAKITEPLMGLRSGVYNRMIELNEFVLSKEFQKNMIQEAQNWNLPNLVKIVNDGPILNVVASKKEVASTSSKEVNESLPSATNSNSTSSKVPQSKVDASFGSSPRSSAKWGLFPVGIFDKGNMRLHVNESDEDGLIVAFEELDKKSVLLSKQLGQRSRNPGVVFNIVLQDFDMCNVLDIKESSPNILSVLFGEQNFSPKCAEIKLKIQKYLGEFTRSYQY